MIEEIDSDTYVKHYFQKVLGELGNDPLRFLKAASDFLQEETDFFHREDCAALLKQLLTQASVAASQAASHEEQPPLQAEPPPLAAGELPSEEVAGHSTSPSAGELHQSDRVDEEASAAPAEELQQEDGQEKAASLAVEEQKKGLKPNAGNGADLEHYSWTQSLQECVITVPVPKGTKGRMCDVQFGRDKLKVALKGQLPVLDGELFATIKPDDSFWNVVDGKVLEITLQKADSMQWWRCIVKGEPEIDTQLVEPESSKLSDLDPEMRATVEKMMFDQRQKALGLPTSEEQHKQDVMKQFMGAHPEMDFSNAKFM